jgi:hypothetical protein
MSKQRKINTFFSSLAGRDTDCCEDAETFLDLSPESKRVSLVEIEGHRNKGKLSQVKGVTFRYCCFDVFQR